MTPYAELEIGLHRAQAGNFEVELRFSDPGSAAEIAPARSSAPIDIEVLRTLSLDPAGYGEALTRALFHDEAISRLFAQVKAVIESSDLDLRLRLLIHPPAAELHALRWELLLDPDTNRPLATSERVLFSRFLASRDWRPIRIRRKAEIRALIAVSAPSDLDAWGLAGIDRDSEIERARSGLAGIDTGRIEIAGKDRPLTLDHLAERLRATEVDVVYLVCHGAFDPDRGARLWFQDEDGVSALVEGSEFAGRLGGSEHLPRLMVLASCDSARGSEAGNALAPFLAAVGIPAILAMQDKIAIETLQRLMPAFFGRLLEDGRIDHALAAARHAVRGRHDSWMPALFTRLKHGRLWYQPGFAGEADDFGKWKSICRRVRQGHFLPILGPDVGEHVCGNTRELADRLAADNQFPLASHDRSDLAKVTQYLSVSQDREYARGAVLEELHRQVIARNQKFVEDADHRPLPELLELAGEHRRQAAEDPYRALAELPGTVYITASAEPLLFKALEANEREPTLLYCNWRPTPDNHPRKPAYAGDPTRQSPVVYHVFGIFGQPDSLVLTEDDFFDYLIATSSYNLMPTVVRGSLTESSLLFLGFQLNDWTFRVLFRLIMSLEGCADLKQYSHVGVQVEPQENSLLDAERARRYLEGYFGTDRSGGLGRGEPRIDIYWGSVDDFLEELCARLETERDEVVPALAEVDDGDWF